MRKLFTAITTFLVLMLFVSCIDVLPTSDQPYGSSAVVPENTENVLPTTYSDFYLSKYSASDGLFRIIYRVGDSFYCARILDEPYIHTPCIIRSSKLEFDGTFNDLYFYSFDDDEGYHTVFFGEFIKGCELYESYSVSGPHYSATYGVQYIPQSNAEIILDPSTSELTSIKFTYKGTYSEIESEPRI